MRGVAKNDYHGTDIGALAMDEEEQAEFGRKNQKPYVSVIGALLWDFVSAYGRVEPLSTLLLSNPGTDAQAAALDAYYDEVAAEKIDYGTDQDLDELGLLVVLAKCSNQQRARLAYSYEFRVQGLS